MLSNLLKNKTTIVNGLTLIIGMIGFLVGQDQIIAHPEIVAGLLTASGALNVLVRVFGTVPK